MCGRWGWCVYENPETYVAGECPGHGKMNCTDHRPQRDGEDPGNGDELSCLARNVCGVIGRRVTRRP